MSILKGKKDKEFNEEENRKLEKFLNLIYKLVIVDIYMMLYFIIHPTNFCK